MERLPYLRFDPDNYLGIGGGDPCRGTTCHRRATRRECMAGPENRGPATGVARALITLWFSRLSASLAAQRCGDLRGRADGSEGSLFLVSVVSGLAPLARFSRRSCFGQPLMLASATITVPSENSTS